MTVYWLALPCALAACTRNVPPRALPTLEGTMVTVTTTDGADVEAQLQGTRDALAFRTSRGDVLALDRVRRVTVTNRGLGALEGLAVGVAVGLGGAAISAVAYTEREGFCTVVCRRSDAALLGGFLVGGVGVVVGLIVGAVKGHEDVYTIERPSRASVGTGGVTWQF